MKYNLKINKTIQNIVIVLLVSIIALSSTAAVSPNSISTESLTASAISRYEAAQLNPQLSDEEKIKVAIDAYFTTRYESQKLLEAQDFSPLLEDNTLDWVKKEKDKREIELYIATLFDLKYVSYNYTLDYDSIEIKNNKATVQLRESHSVVFEIAAPEVSKLGNLPHTITLHQKQGYWVIFEDNYQDEGSAALQNHTKQELLKQVDENYKLSQKHAVSGIKVWANNIPYAPLTLTNYSYNRTKAVNYADTYWNTASPPYYVGLSQDCTNFVSQALYAGEGKTPPDTSGMTTSPTRNINTDWYYVWNNSGSAPWVGVPQQYSFITGNTNKIGPYGQSAGVCSTSVGDIVQIYDSAQGGWFHEGIITLIVNPCGGLQFYYVDAHTTNRYHYMLANWAQYSMRFIKINGWRGN